jgi:hypothetical protein
MRFLLIMAMTISTAWAVTIPSGQCQNFTLFDEMGNYSYLGEICAENATIIQNITIFENITYNITQNITVQQCNATNATLWANSSGIFNNATVLCLSNISSIINTISCNFSSNITPSESEQRLTNVSGLDITIKAIPQNYCYQNAFQELNSLGIYRNDRCNTTVICRANVSECPVCEVCGTCPEPIACPACETCQSCENAAANAVYNCNQTIWGAGGYIEQLRIKDETAAQKSAALAEVEKSIDKKVDDKTGNINDTLMMMMLAGIVGLGAWVAKTRTAINTGKYGKAISADEAEKLVPKKEV